MTFAFETRLENYLAAAYTLLKQDGRAEIAELLRRARPELQLGTSTDNWNGGTYAHTLCLYVSLEEYGKLEKEIGLVQEQIRDKVNFVSSDLSNESIEQVSFLPLLNSDTNWRTGEREVPRSAGDAIWGENGYRVFISHLAVRKADATELKRQLSVFGCACFVAHEDIEPTKKWEDTIERALMTMDCLVALMVDGFHESKWTDQEIGFACARGVKIIPVSQGELPYGFIGKFQALKVSPDRLAWEVFKRMPMFDDDASAFVSVVNSIKSFDDAVQVAKMFDQLPQMPEKVVDAVLQIALKNQILRDSTTFWSRTKHSAGFHHYITKWLGYDYVYDFETSSYKKTTH